MPTRITGRGGKKGKGKYTVSTPKGTKAKSTTKGKAKRQARLLRAIDHGWRPSRKAK